MTKQVTTKNSVFEITGYSPIPYHIDTVWNSGKKERLEITGIEWVDTDTEVASRIDIITETKLFDLSVTDDYWLLSVSNSTGDSFSHQYRAAITYVDIFDNLTDAENTAKLVEEFINGIKSFTLPNNGYIPYVNSCQCRMLSLAHLDAVFDYPDGVFITKVQPEHVKRWPYNNVKR